MTTLTWALCNHDAIDAKIVSDETIKKIEKEFQKQMGLASVSKEKIFYIHMLAAREFLNYGYLEKSEKYYQKSIDLNPHLNATEAYLNLVLIAIRQKEEPKIKKRIESALDYFYKKNKALLNPVLKRHLSFLSVAFLNKGSPEQKEKVYNDYMYGYYARLKQIERDIEQGKFTKAYLGFNPNGLEHTDIGTKTTYDLLNIIVNKKKVKKLLCRPIYDKYPKAYSYSMKVCKILKKFRKEGKISPKYITNLENYFKSNHQDKKYVLKAVKHLSGL